MKMLVSMVVVFFGIKFFGPRLGESYDKMLDIMIKLNGHEVVKSEDF